MKIMLGSARASVGAMAAVIFLMTGVPVQAQQVANQPIVSYPTNTRSSDPLGSLSPALGTVAGEQPRSVPLQPLPQSGVPGGQNANDRALQSKAGARLKPEAGPLFSGIVQDGYIPPDTNIAVGPTEIVQVVNSEIAVFDKSGAMLIGYPKKLGSIWGNLGGGCSINNSGDPVVQYDRAADRWLVTQLGSLNSPYSECIAVSQTNDPTGAYYLYAYSFGSNLNDYPKFGVWSTANNSAYLATYNMFANGQNFTGAELCAYDRQAMLSGAASPAQVCFTTGDGGVLPSDVDGSIAPGASEPGYFLAFDSATLSNLHLYQLLPNFANPSSSTLSGPTALPVNAFQMACGGGTCIPQPGTTEQLDSLGDRLMYRLAWRKFSDGHEAMVVNHSVAAGSSVGLRWYELDASTPGNFTVIQQSTFAPDASYRWMGSAAMDQGGDIALGYSLSSSTVYPGIYLTARLQGDPINTMETEVALQAGGGSQTGFTRWGDYSAMRIDPSDDCTFWYASEYYPSTSSYNWHTFIGSFKFTGCGGAPTPDFSLGESPSPVTVTAGYSNTGTVTVTALNGFSAGVTLSANCALPISCSFSPNPVTSPLTSTLTVNAAAGAPAGSTTETITGTSGSLVHTTSFTVTVPAANFTMTAASPSLTIARGSSANDAITLTSSGSSSVSFSASGLPRQTSVSFSPNPVNSNGSTSMTINVGKRAARGTYSFTVTATNGTYKNSIPISLTIQ